MARPKTEEHYEQYRNEALVLAAKANHYTYGDGGDPVVGHALAAEAQVYATLALAEATRRNVPINPFP